MMNRELLVCLSKIDPRINLIYTEKYFSMFILITRRECGEKILTSRKVQGMTYLLPKLAIKLISEEVL